MTTKISLCMIAKDEEQTIGRCLQSVSGVVDEIIVVDTGSSDKTCQIAQAFGAKVQSFNWNNNFSDARNVSLNLATGEWILFLDADEKLAKESREILRKAVLNSEVDGYFMKIVNLSGDDSTPETSADMVFRLFRNKPNFRFRGVVHEQICDVIIEQTGQSQFLFSEELVIYHDGYLNSHLKAKDKKRRNLILIEKELHDKPDDCLVQFYHAVELYRMGENLSAAEEFEKVSTMINPAEILYGPKLMRYIVQTYYAANKVPEALNAVQRGLALFPCYADLYFLGGQLYFQLKEYGLAYEYFKKALQAPDLPVHYASFSGIKGFRSCYYLGLIAEKFCNEEEALRYYIDSLRDNGRFLTALDSILGILQPRINPDYTQYAIDKICDISLPQAKLMVGQLLFKHAAYGLALEYFEKVPDSFFTSELLLCKAICLIHQQRSLEAINILEAIDGGEKFNPFAKMNKLLCFWLAGNKQKILEMGEELLTLGLTKDHAAVVKLLQNTDVGQPVSLGSEGMALVLDILKRAFDLGQLNLCTLLLSSISPESLLDYYLPLGELFYQYGHTELAEQYLCQHLQENSDSTTAYFLLAEIKQGQGGYLEAIDYYRKALQSDPKEPKYYIKLMKLYEKIGSEVLKQAAERYPELGVKHDNNDKSCDDCT
ncbi:glycosyltransferase involved in cell wall biosynthesis [Sporomusaceae bacterium BoRhaA]|uniref:TPR domain-containing glycosyltransferase n=1 Tax=Pelorhabdus rhamnosifermentans TaxID=2772457 RepID=UPI001C060155|nr:TPR domain-containing glycosyltransferase [Pelorhabdus rhamnosifermentans]MBU2700873.1 glycosyltransferase involved in cell wall biosynthesis [Pelorhabdus rhamnosifermentans]